MQSLGLDIRVLDMDHHEIELRDMDDDSNEHLNIDTLSKLAEEQQKKQLAKETAETSEEAPVSANEAPVDESDDKVSK